jgi:lysylphosphatidylglycerol synthetase-like protein (DUF2156 family)
MRIIFAIAVAAGLAWLNANMSAVSGPPGQQETSWRDRSIGKANHSGIEPWDPLGLKKRGW